MIPAKNEEKTIGKVWSEPTFFISYLFLQRMGIFRRETESFNEQKKSDKEEVI